MSSDTWIIGCEADSAHEYVIHLQSPRFIARFDDREEAELTLEGGLSVTVDGTEFSHVEWLDGTPGLDDTGVLDLFKRANDAITRWSFGREEDDEDGE